MQCPQCKKEIPNGAKRCPECQADLRNWFVRHKILSGILVLIFLTIILSSTENTTSTKKIVINKKGKKIEVEKKYQKVINLKTTSSKNSDTFKLEGGKQKLIYKLKKKQFSNCTIYLLDDNVDLQKDGVFPVVMSAEENGKTILRKSTGNYYLAIRPANTSCEVELLEMR